MRMTGYETFKTYLALKQHFSNEKYDFFLYDGKVRAKEETYIQRNDFYFFETLARKLNDEAIKEYMLASFIDASSPGKIWVGDIKRSGKDKWLAWQKRMSSLPITFKREIESLFYDYSFNSWFDTSSGHPILLKEYIRGGICLETLIVLDIVLGFMSHWDKVLHDPLWETTFLKVRKYKPFLSIDRKKYKDILQNIILT